eukprot:INCI13445.5.p1 GENE.INCI13445.5~~INCI13445.5.p1  ORF type:complete len:707 (-),score=113.36 INCI13445.5:2421-4541(-)
MKAHTHPAHRFSGQFVNFEDLEHHHQQQQHQQQRGSAVASSSSSSSAAATLGSNESDAVGLLSRRSSTHESRDKIMQKSLLGANSSHTSSAAVTDVNIFSAVLNPVTLFFHSAALERKYRFWAFKSFSGSFAIVYLFLALTSVLFALGNVYVQLLINNVLGDLSQDPPPFFIYSPPDKPIQELDACNLDDRLTAFNAQYNFTNNTFSICGLTIKGNYKFTDNVFFFMHSCFAILWMLEYIFLKLANKRMEGKALYHPYTWYGISIVSWAIVLWVKLSLFSLQKLPFSMMGFPVGYEIMLMMACITVLHGLPYMLFSVFLVANCLGLFVWFWFMLGQFMTTYIFMFACVAMTLAMGLRYMRSMERWNRHSFIMFERLVAAEIRTDLDTNPFKIGNLINWAQTNSNQSAADAASLGRWSVKYEDIDFQSRVASGGSGVIWWGRYHDQKVAIKEIYSVMTSSGLQLDELEEFGNEVRVLRALSASTTYHQGLLKFFGVSKTAGVSAPRLFMVMEWCSLPLDALLQKRDATPVANLPDPSDRNWVVLYGAIVASAVEWMHERGVVHRDLKPSNILLQTVGEHDRVGAYIDDSMFERVFGCRYMKVKLADFGLAVLHTESDQTDFASVESETGTPGFMAPELFHSNKAAPIDTLQKWQLVDSYALGMTVAAMSTSASDPFTSRLTSPTTGRELSENELRNINPQQLIDGEL